MTKSLWPILTMLPLLACSTDAEPAADPWAGKTFLLEVPKHNWSEPRGIGDEIGEFVPFFMLEVEAGDDDGEYSVTVGTASEGPEQDLCTPTTVFEATSEGAGELQIGPNDFPVHLEHISEDVAVNATIYDLSLTNILPPSEEGELTAIMDMRELYPMFTLIPEPSPEAVCNALSSFEAPCEPCPTDSEEFCLSLTAVRLAATEIADGSLEPVAPNPGAGGSSNGAGGASGAAGAGGQTTDACGN
jgi:hypothetical protein